MVSITLSIPEEVREQMKRFSEINWSAFVRSCIESKAKELAWKQEMLEKLNSPEEQELIKWSVELGRKAKEERLKDLKKRKLL
ncbi:MAG: hypothetical protein QT05_C0039G0012 [archaeon GW2011_AR13]|nr:MAG: hypothetical protein QT05_C0039G0012 [archaeon GW2011_AR13]HIG94170.1 hypothetical protein [Nanoarchaeota archaeon]HIH62720.1 hypothetical protein [Nanoarchaeota archaeon]HIJ09925.1 hypothetical protein [Nanoarchaeota archaeon]